VKNRLEIVPVKWIDQVLEAALARMPEPIPEEEAAAAPAEGDGVKPAAPAAAGGVVKH
jgi:ATP-dependent Lon protease